MFKNILIPTDGSKFSEKVDKDGVALAKLFNAKITGVHVTQRVFILPMEDFAAYDAEVLKRIEEDARKAGKRYLKHLETAARAGGVTYESVLVDEKPAWEGIMEAAQKHHCDLIMMAAHGRSGIKALVLGSETHKVLTHSKIPVLVYR